MMYFLDFDRTLFDTDTFNASLPDEPGCAPFADELRTIIAEGRDQTLTGGEKRVQAWLKVSDALKSGALSFPPGHLERFLYADVKEFLRALGNEALVITFGDEYLQRMKVESALANVVRTTVIYTGTTTKADYLASWPGYHGGPAIFVDDREAELAMLGERFPALSLFKMAREGAHESSHVAPPLWRIIHSLSELP